MRGPLFKLKMPPLDRRLLIDSARAEIRYPSKGDRVSVAALLQRLARLKSEIDDALERARQITSFVARYGKAAFPSLSGKHVDPAKEAIKRLSEFQRNLREHTGTLNDDWYRRAYKLIHVSNTALGSLRTAMDRRVEEATKASAAKVAKHMADLTKSRNALEQNLNAPATSSPKLDFRFSSTSTPLPRPEQLKDWRKRKKVKPPSETAGGAVPRNDKILEHAIQRRRSVVSMLVAGEREVASSKGEVLKIARLNLAKLQERQRLAAIEARRRQLAAEQARRRRAAKARWVDVKLWDSVMEGKGGMHSAGCPQVRVVWEQKHTGTGKRRFHCRGCGRYYYPKR